MSALVPSPPEDKINCVRERCYNVLALFALPILGAVAAIRQPGLNQLVRLAVLAACNILFVAHLGILQRRLALQTAKPVRLGPGAVLAAVALAGFFFISPPLFVVGLILTAIVGVQSHSSINPAPPPLASFLVLFSGAALYFIGGYLTFSHPTAAGFAVALCLGAALAAGCHWSGNSGNHPHPFRRVGRGLYPALAAALLLWRSWTWWWW